MRSSHSNFLLSFRVLRKIKIQVWPTYLFPSMVFYNGQALPVSIFNGSGQNILHEIGHFIAASQERKRVPNFGLGLDGRKGTFFAPLMVDTATADAEELKVCRLERKLKHAIIPYAELFPIQEG